MTDTYLKAITEHITLLAGIALVGWFVFSRARDTVNTFRSFVGHELEERLPRLMKEELQNGLGDLIEMRVRKVMNEDGIAYYPSTRGPECCCRKGGRRRGSTK